MNEIETITGFMNIKFMEHESKLSLITNNQHFGKLIITYNKGEWSVCHKSNGENKLIRFKDKDNSMEIINDSFSFVDGEGDSI